MKCRDCRHWQSEWYNEDAGEMCGYGCHYLLGGLVNIGICLLVEDTMKNARIEDCKACEQFEKAESAVGDDIENLLFGE